jgi:hypothetical protein
MNLPSALYDAMMRVPSERIRVLTPQEQATFGLDEVDPAEQELLDSAEARGYGLSKIEYMRRKSQVSTVVYVPGRGVRRIVGIGA